jgi:hypothetical protein
MKLDRTFEVRELPAHVTEAIVEVVKEHVDGLIDDFDDTLMKHGKRIAVNDREEVMKELMFAANVKVKIAVELTEGKLNDWHIFPEDLMQSKLSAYEVEQ